ncbi:MAG: hypothetical protein JSW63_02385 [Ignavibacterium sp.]|nr:MAG: hypothetical protein JSW63_02385 [Ignavibacterium sp.]
MKKNLIRSFVVIASFFALTFYTGCDTAETTDGTVTVSFSPPSITPKISDDTIQLDTVKILLRDIKIKNQSGNDEMNIKVGPFVVYLNINEITTNFAIGNVSPGSYDRIRFRVHTLEDSETPPDPEFKDGSLRYSVIVKGLYNSTPFVYKSKKSAHQDLKLENIILVTDNSTANLTITVDPLSWFYENNILMDPTNQSNESDIDNNIEHSFKKCFRDDNHDGK